MDETAEAIKFDYRGFCNYCLQFEQKKKYLKTKVFIIILINFSKK